QVHARLVGQRLRNLDVADVQLAFFELDRLHRVPPVRLSGSREDQAAGRHAGAGGHEHVVDGIDLVAGRAADLAHRLRDAVHAVDVCLTQQAAVGVDGQLAAE